MIPNCDSTLKGSNFHADCSTASGSDHFLVRSQGFCLTVCTLWAIIFVPFRDDGRKSELLEKAQIKAEPLIQIGGIKREKKENLKEMAAAE